ncbi:glyoxylate/hydroxypyruvate reductase GhrB [Siccibacter turicensis]|uniref:Glyoxylate/hydroxypyruvate reductase B n=1 Tax=Siccibacter turicensis TaxID=357233 RepID=A0A2P8VI35_9ENTR|nr:glyoxylate/hydroxypyruvate reductase GhrB [Siccibacter turicensis]PSN07221.1 glyoxylate/hydroxypyruvate reductase GhrB [Siccibacter turicensis]
MKPSVILYKALPDDLLARLEHHFTVTQVNDLSPETVSQHESAFARAEGLLGSSEKVDSALLEKMPKLRATSTVSVGYDNFDVDALNERRILLMHTPTVLTETVADTMMTLVLATARRALDVAERVKKGEWTGSIGPDWFGIDVHHKTLGIIGMGRIGLALAQRAHFGFSMPVLYNARRHHPEAEERFNARYCDIDTLLAESDFVCVVLPLTDETRHMIGKAQFERMKNSAIFINAGRGPVVDEQALIAALQSGEIYAAGLDVFEQEPLPTDSPLLTLPNVVALPHIGSATHETRYNMAACAVDNLIDALNGKVEKNCVNPQVAS